MTSKTHPKAKSELACPPPPSQPSTSGGVLGLGELELAMSDVAPGGHEATPVITPQPSNIPLAALPAVPVVAPCALVGQLQQLVELRNQGALTEAEFLIAKGRVLAEQTSEKSQSDIEIAVI